MPDRVKLGIMASIVLASVSTSAAAAVEREDIIMLAADGQHFTSYKTLRSDLNERVLYLGPEESPKDALFIVPTNYKATSLPDGGTRLRFNGGSFAIMAKGRFDKNVARTENGDLIFTSWDGQTRSDGHIGKWNSPGNFDSFAYSWVVPDNIEIRSYNANRPGKWTQRGNTLSWHGDQVNDIAFTIRYRKTGEARAEQKTRAAPRSKSQPAPQRQPAPTAVEKRAARARPAKINLKVAEMASVPLRKAPAESINQPDDTEQTPSETQKPTTGASKAKENSLLLDQMVTLSNGRPLITADGHIVLDRLARRLAASDTAIIRITGPAVKQPSDTGGSAANAARVADYLTARGVDADRIVSGPGSNNGETGPQQIRIAVQPAEVLAGFKPGP